MNFSELNKELQNVNAERIRVETVIEQATNRCREIEQKYNISSVEELELILNQKKQKYENAMFEAETYINNTKQVLSQYQGVL